MIIKGGKIMIEVKTLKRYLRLYNIPYAYNKTMIYVPGAINGNECFWRFSIKCSIITDCYMLFEIPNDTTIKKCYDNQKRFRYSRRLNESTLNKVIKLMHTSYNHTIEQMATVC